MSLLPSWDYQLKCVDLDRQSQQEFWKETKSSVKLNEAHFFFLQKNFVLIWTSTFNLCIQKYRKKTETREKKEIKKKNKIKQKIKLPNVIRIVCHPRKNVFVIRLLHYRIPSLNKTQKKTQTQISKVGLDTYAWTKTFCILTCWQSFGTLSAHLWWNLHPQVRQQKP